MKASPWQHHHRWASTTMLQRSKSAGKQAARQMGYVPLAATQEGGASNPPGKFSSRNVSPGPDQLAKRPPAVKRTIAPGQVHAWLLHAQFSAFCMQCMGSERSFCMQPAPGARSKEKFVSLPEELEELELPPPQLDVPSQLFEARLLSSWTERSCLSCRP